MNLPETIEGRFVRRDNRFRVTVEIDGEQVAAHLPNSGRLGELLTPGRVCCVVPKPGKHRRTHFDLLLVDYAGVLVSVDARLPNKLFAEAVAARDLRPFQDVATIESEVIYGDSRLDFRLGGKKGSCWVEAKSVTLVEEGTALFPDAPTRRGQRHLAELASLVRTGERAAVVFVIQRPDPEAFQAHAEADPDFAQALSEAVTAGVEAYAFRCKVTRGEIRIVEGVPVRV